MQNRRAYPLGHASEYTHLSWFNHDIITIFPTLAGSSNYSGNDYIDHKPQKKVWLCSIPTCPGRLPRISWVLNHFRGSLWCGLFHLKLQGFLPIRGGANYDNSRPNIIIHPPNGREYHPWNSLLGNDHRKRVCVNWPNSKWCMLNPDRCLLLFWPNCYGAIAGRVLASREPSSLRLAVWGYGITKTVFPNFPSVILTPVCLSFRHFVTRNAPDLGHRFHRLTEVLSEHSAYVVSWPMGRHRFFL